MRHLKNKRWRIALILIVYVTVCFAASLAAGQPAYALGHETNGDDKVIVIATITGAAAEPGQYPATDTITLTGGGAPPTLTAPQDAAVPPKVTPAGLVVTYETTSAYGYSWFSDGPPPTIKACSQVLNGLCATVTGIESGAPLPDQIITIKGTTDNPGGTSPGPTSTATPTLTCNAGFNPLNWLLCAAVSGLVAIANELDNLINSQLSVGTDDAGNSDGTPTAIFGPCTKGAGNPQGQTVCSSAAYKDAWGSFRDIALGLLVVASLIVVIASALGIEILDAYTIRKVLPRIIIVAIAITLSWQLMEFFVKFTNDLGYGVRYLIYAPFQKLNLTLSLGGGAGVAVDLIGGAAITALGIFGLVLFALTAVLSLFTGFVVMILRQILITMLIIIAPIAIVCYILPNTQRFYHMWWNAFSRALLMFVIIIALITAGRVFAAVADQDGANPINQMVAFGAYFGVYLLIPKTWQMGGAALAATGNMINSSAQGSNNWLRKKRGEHMATNLSRTRAGQRWNQNFGKFKNPLADRTHKRGAKKGEQTYLSKKLGHFNSVGKLANSMAMNAFDQDELARLRIGQRTPLFKRYAAKTVDEIDDHKMDQAIKGYQEVEKAGGMHWKAWQALTGRGMQGFKGNVIENGVDTGRSVSSELAQHFQNKDGTWKGPESLDEFHQLTEIMGKSSDDKERTGAKDLMRNEGYLSTIKSRPGMEYADLQAMGVLGAAAEGRADPDMLADTINSMGQNRKGGLAHRTLLQAQKIGVGKRPDIAMGKGIRTNADGELESVWGRQTAYRGEDGQVEYGKPPGYDPLNDSAVDAVLSYKSNDWTSAKSETIDTAEDTLMALATYTAKGDTYSNLTDTEKKDREEHGRQIRGLIKYQSGEYGAMEPAARAKWAKMRSTIEGKGISMPDFHGNSDVSSSTEPHPAAVAPPPGGGGQQPGADPAGFEGPKIG